VARQSLNIRNIASDNDADSGRSHVSFMVEVPDLFVLSKLRHSLERLPGVEKVQRIG
jgi:(p)ppGpp synthase/HD superfamily hydrolase